MSTKCSNIDPAYPVWEISNFNLPQNVYTQHNTFYQEGFDSANLRQECKHLDENFATQWYNNCVNIEHMLKNCTLDVVKSIWYDKIKNDFNWPKENQAKVNILLDKQNFSMSSHLDNRYVLGVLIINLQDNTCSTFFDEMNWQSPTQKGTGVFMLNHINTLHSIHNNTTHDRIIGYQTITIDSFYDKR